MAQVQYGVTPPIAMAYPNDKEIAATDSLMDELKRKNVFESPEEAKRREIVLGQLDSIVKSFVREVSLRNGMNEKMAEEAGAKIFTFGSYRLGVHGPGADIDTLVVVPRHVAREDFFGVLDGMLKGREECSEVAGVPDAYVPLISLKFSNIPIDLTFARLALATIPDDLDLRHDYLLKNLDERCVRSLNGSRVTDEILRLVPSVPVFRDALRTIKLWAKRRAIYSNVMGFCGGVAWAMLVARICQLYPNLNAGAIVSRFFLIMFQWKWPQPVLLKAIEEGPLNVRVWNPRLYQTDRSHRMPIITPAYPSMCSTHNVTISTLKIMKEEFERGASIVDKIIVRQAEWRELFDHHDFFSKYRYYLQITASSSDPEIQLKWAGTVESKIRHLVMKLEYEEGLELAHPFIKPFERINYCADAEETSKVSMGELPDAVLKRTNSVEIAGKEGSQTVSTSTFYIGLKIKRPPEDQPGPRRLDISYPTTDFTKLVKMWDGFDQGTMGIIVRYMKSSALPDYVFEHGERDRQSRSAKRRQPDKGLKRDSKKIKTEETQPLKRVRPSSFVPDASMSPAPADTSSLPSPPTGSAVPIPAVPTNGSATPQSTLENFDPSVFGVTVQS